MKSPSSLNPGLTPNSSEPTVPPVPNEAFDLAAFKQTKEAQKLVAWVQSEHERAKQARTQRQLQWYSHMAFFYGQHWLEKTTANYPEHLQNKLVMPKAPYYKNRKTVNRIRSFVRSEIAQYLSSIPEAVAVPATAEDEDVRSAYAAEQAWSSISQTGKLRYHFSRSVWWMVVTGNGFVKTWWDQAAIDKASGQQGIMRYGNVTPFHFFVPDLREQDIDDQPFVINAYVKTVSWCQTFFSKQLDGHQLKATAQSSNQILDNSKLNLGNSANEPDSCVVYETYFKPGAHEFFPNGGLLQTIDDQIVSLYREGLPYKHGEYPFTKFENIPTSTFYADSALVDLTELQREYNTLRSQISDAGHRMARPQLISPEGSVIPTSITNEPGQIITYKPGFQPPTPLQLSPLPDYYVSQQDRILTDIEDIGGQHDVSRGVAPAGVTAGTAINFLQEADNGYRTPQYQSIEDGYERIAGQTVENFIQFVDVKRKIKTIGADGSFDVVLLEGADVTSGTDIRIQRGSSVGTSKAAADQRVMDLFSVGIIDQPLALKLMEIGGAQKILDIMNVAERKAQRENMKMKMLKPDVLEQYRQQAEMQEMLGGMGQLSGSDGQDPFAPQDPEAVDPNGGVDPSVMLTGQPSDPEPVPPLVPVDDFDIHEKHIEVHNTFRMSQEYEALPPEIKEQFELHVKEHERLMLQKSLSNFLSAMPSDGSDGEPDPNNLDVTTGEAGMPEDPNATMAGDSAPQEAAPENGAV